jgi:hypothetical protein
VAMNAVVHSAGYCASMRVEEIPKSDIGGTAGHQHVSVNHCWHPHITLALKGRGKGKAADRCHLLPLTMTTILGLRNGLWIQRLVCRHFDHEGNHNGPTDLMLKGRQVGRRDD